MDSPLTTSPTPSPPSPYTPPSSSPPLPPTNLPTEAQVSSPPPIVTSTSPSPSPSRPLLKLLLLTLFPTALAITADIAASRYWVSQIYSNETGTIATFPMKNTNWQDLGTVIEPLIAIPIKTQVGYEENQFLLDSGAVISSLSRNWAEKTGQNLAFLPRSTFRGYGNTISFAYQGQMSLLLGQEEITLPVAFTEAADTKSLLGRKGFFENYSVYFNHKQKQIEIRQ